MCSWWRWWWTLQRGESATPPYPLQATPLFLACHVGNSEEALLLLSKGADPNKAAKESFDGNVTVVTPLYYAIEHGSTEVVRSLLASGARQDLDTGGGNAWYFLLLFDALATTTHWQHTGASPWEAADIAIEEYEGEGEDGKGTHINAYIEIKKLLEAAQSGGLQWSHLYIYIL